MATNARFDDNHVPSLVAVDSANGTATVAVKANPSTHGIIVSDAHTGTDHGPAQALKDANHVPALMAVSSVDGVTPVAVYADASTGALLVDST